MENKKKIINTEFASDVREGLTTFPKYLSSKYIYDKKGDKLFQEIMELPDYYLTSCEFNILEKHKKLIAEYFRGENGFDFIELGAGDGKKTKILLKQLIEQAVDFEYLPIDISQHVLNELEESLKKELPKVKVQPMQGSYFKTLEKLASYTERKKVIVVLGSNIGNLKHEQAIDFLKNIRSGMSANDMLFMGFDQKKDPETILKAYDDPTGVTAAFNKNLLIRINAELDSNFNINRFLHWETYDPETGTAKSFLVSREEQEVHISALDLNIKFKKWETVHTEISQKYDDEVVDWLAQESGLKVIEYFSDEQQYYKNYIFQKS